MNKIIKTICVCLILSVLCYNSLNAQQAQPAQKVNVNYQLSSFANTAGYPPENIIMMDNNLEILLICMGGATLDELKEKKVMLTTSQLRLLIEWNLLIQQENMLITTFPILNDGKIKYLRSQLKTVAKAVGDHIKGDISELSRLFQDKGQEKYVYPAMISYIMDELVWQELEKMKIRVKTPLSVVQPFWTGAVWAVQTPRTFMLGTTSVAKDGISFRINWSNRTGNLLNKMLAKIDDFNALLAEFAASGEIVTKETIDTFKNFGVLDDTGKILVPVIDENTDNKLFTTCRTIAKKITDKFLSSIDFDVLQKELNSYNTLQAFAVAYHEFMIEFMDHLVSDNQITPPRPFVTTSEVSDISAGEMVLLIKTKLETEPAKK